MTFNTREQSNTGGAPVELYEFIIAENRYRFTSSKNQALGLDGQIYTPVAIKRTSIQKSDNLERSRLSIDVEFDNPIASMFKVDTPDVDIFVKVKRSHRGETEEAIYWQGYVTGCTFNTGRAKLDCEPIAGLLSKNAMSMTYQKRCNHRIYKSGCDLSFDDFARNATVNGIENNGHTLRINDLTEDDHFYLDGLAKLGSSHRHIEAYDRAAKKIHLLVPFENLQVGDVIQVARGCSGSLVRCKDIGNFNEYLGFPWMPHKNPFESGL